MFFLITKQLDRRILNFKKSLKDLKDPLFFLNGQRSIMIAIIHMYFAFYMDLSPKPLFIFVSI